MPWVIDLGQGEAEQLAGGFVTVKPQKGCVYFGRAGKVFTPEEACDYREDFGRSLRRTI